MKIEYLGHACFRLGDCLVIDPYKDGSVPGLPELQTFGVKVICSHGHADHSGVECVELMSGECEFGIVEEGVFMMTSRGLLGGRIRFL